MPKSSPNAGRGTRSCLADVGKGTVPFPTLRCGAWRGSILRSMPGSGSARRSAGRCPSASTSGATWWTAGPSEPERPALLWRDAAGAERRLTYADVSAARATAPRTCSAALGVAAGDPVIVMLPRVPEWQAVIVGLLEIGALVVPSSTQLRPKDVLYRATHSGAVAIVASQECVDAVDAVRGELPSRAALPRVPRSAERPRPGWIDLADALARQPDDASARPADARERSRARLLHLGHHRARRRPCCTTTATPGRSATPSRFWHGVRARRPALDHQRHRLGEGRLRRDLRAVERGRRGGAVPRPLRAARRARVPVRGSQPHVFCAPPTEFRLLVKEDLLALRGPAAARVRVGGRAAQPRGDPRLARGDRHHDPRRLRADRDDPARRQLSRARRCARARWACRCPGSASR